MTSESSYSSSDEGPSRSGSSSESEDSIQIETRIHPKKKRHSHSGSPVLAKAMPKAPKVQEYFPIVSFKKGFPIAKCFGGLWDKKILRVDEHGSRIDMDPSVIKSIVHKVCKRLSQQQGKELKRSEVDSIYDSIIFSSSPRTSKLKPIYELVYSELAKRGSREIEILDGKLLPIVPDKIFGPSKQNFRISIMGPSGAGKSWITNKLLRSFLAQYPDGQIYIISALHDDPTLEEGISNSIRRIIVNQDILGSEVIENERKKKMRKELKVEHLTRAQLDEKKYKQNKEFLDNLEKGTKTKEELIREDRPRPPKPIVPPLTIRDFGGGENTDPMVIVFDDVEAIDTSGGELDRKVYKHIIALKNAVYTTGRHYNMNVISISHKIRGGIDTTTDRFEADDFIFFPQSGSGPEVADYLTKKMQKTDIDKMMSLSSRWVQIHKSSPGYILHARGMWFL